MSSLFAIMDLFDDGKVRAKITSRKRRIKIVIPTVIGMLYAVVATLVFIDAYEDRQKEKLEKDCSLEMNKRTLEVDLKC